MRAAVIHSGHVAYAMISFMNIQHISILSIDSKSLQFAVGIVIMYKNHSRIAKLAESSSDTTSATYVTYSTTTQQKKLPTAISVGSA